MSGVAQGAGTVEDLVLVDQCLDGAREATSELFRRHQRRVHATLYRVLGCRRDMDDLLQETFIQVFHSLASFRGEARLSTWIDRIAVRVAYRYLARRKEAALSLDVIAEPEAGIAAADDHAMAREGVRRLYAALAELPPASRIAFSLHEIDGRSVSAVAECVGASVTATKLRIWRARRSLLKRAQGDPVLADFLSDVTFGAEEIE
jgi:RNA polymerase sigma-70 factor (ECF subfamily)